MRPRRPGLTLLELLIAAGILATVVGVAWLSLLGTFRRIRTVTSLSAAIEASLVILETFSRDVDQMVMPPFLGEKPMVIATDGTAISFYLPVLSANREMTTTAAWPVVYHLLPAPHGLFRPARNGRPLGPVLLSQWRFSYVTEGHVRLVEGIEQTQTLGMVSARGGDLGEGERPSNISTDAAPPVEESHLESADPTIPLSDPLEHAGPYLILRFTVVDDGGAALHRAVLFDLVNAHMSADHGKDFPLPRWAFTLEGGLMRFRRDGSRGISVPVEPPRPEPSLAWNPWQSGPKGFAGR